MFVAAEIETDVVVAVEALGAIIIFAAALLAVGGMKANWGLDAGLVGLLMSYASSSLQALNWVVRSSSEVETNIVSIERILEYTSVPSEAPLERPDHTPNDSWPQKGEVVFKDYQARYRDDLDLVLHGVSFEVKPGEKIGICGRTGCVDRSSASIGRR